MLRELAVSNFALIEDARVELRPGLCAWTGETGAGKSLLLAALGLLLGERGSADLLRAGASELRVCGRFELAEPLAAKVEALLHEPLEEGVLIVSRRLARAGKSVALVNGEAVTLATLRKLGELLIDVHGQRETHSLLQPAYQLELLDAFGRLGELRERYRHQAHRVRACRRKLADAAAERQRRLRELDLARFEREELEAAELEPGELAALAAERERLANADALGRFAGGAAETLYDADGSVVERLGRLSREADGWAGVGPDYARLAERFGALLPEVQDLAGACRSLAERLEADPERLERVERRVQKLRRIENKYRRSIDEVIAYRDTLAARERDLQREEDGCTTLERDLARCFDELRRTAAELSAGRRAVADRLAAETQAHLADLGMPHARLDAGLVSQPIGDDPEAADVPAAGADRLEFALAANPGEPARPLRKVASGGELSRALLALKTVLAAHDPVGTLVFDEIDSNVGGRLGDALGRKLAALGATHQVICVTHLPQVASYAAHQWTIRKRTDAGRTGTTITQLAVDGERVEELAQMMRGESRAETTRREARAMLEAAQAS